MWSLLHEHLEYSGKCCCLLLPTAAEAATHIASLEKRLLTFATLPFNWHIHTNTFHSHTKTIGYSLVYYLMTSRTIVSRFRQCSIMPHFSNHNEAIRNNLMQYSNMNSCWFAFCFSFILMKWNTLFVHSQSHFIWYRSVFASTLPIVCSISFSTIDIDYLSNTRSIYSALMIHNNYWPEMCKLLYHIGNFQETSIRIIIIQIGKEGKKSI